MQEPTAWTPVEVTSVITTILIFFGLVASAVATFAATRQVRQSRQQFEATHRPWVGLKELSVHLPAGSGILPEVRIEMHYQNIGSLPALDLELQLHAEPIVPDGQESLTTQGGGNPSPVDQTIPLGGLLPGEPWIQSWKESPRMLHWFFNRWVVEVTGVLGYRSDEARSYETRWQATLVPRPGGTPTVVDSSWNHSSLT